MIRVRKGDAPRKLAREGVAKAAAHAAEHDADPTAYAEGTRCFAFAKGIYAHRTVQDALERAQHGKCCYCEVKIDKPYAFLHVEHWRPKGSVRQRRDVRASQPGYYWLAYDWGNLFLACHFCNSANKSDLFPLANEADRARTPQADLAAEKPLLLRPDGPDDPGDHIAFHDEVPVGRTSMGRQTIAVLGLDRTEHAVRLRLFEQLRTSKGFFDRYYGEATPAALDIVYTARRFIEDAARPEAPFSAMAKAFVAANPLPP